MDHSPRIATLLLSYYPTLPLTMKLLISDIDGSLLPFGKSELSPTIVSFFRSLPDQHVHATLATGKPFLRTRPLAQTLGITTPLICANGALIVHPVSGKIILCEPIEEHTAQAVIQLLAHDVRCQLYPEVEDRLFYVRNTAIPTEAWRHRRPGWTEPLVYDPEQDMKETLGGSPHKIAVSTSPADRETIETLLKSHFGEKVSIFHPKPDIIDVTPKTASKGTAAARIALRLGIQREDVVVVGDEMNDISLFEAAGIKLARDHAPDALLAKADIIVGPGDDALILALKQALKI